MDQLTSIAFALDPNNIPGFLLDWELTMKCNLDCSYCAPGLYNGHDNSTDHPPLSECLESIDFMYSYVDEYMKYKKPSQRKVFLNVYGGESIFHPDIVEILQNCHSRYQKYKDNWHLTISCTTNGIAGPNLWNQIVPLIHDFTMSYHPENLPKQKEQFTNNLLYLKEQQKRFKCLVIMHNDPKFWDNSESMIEFCKANSIKYLPRALDNEDLKWSYTNEQYNKFKVYWVDQSPKSQQEKYKVQIDTVGTLDQVSSIAEGRACCGGRMMSTNNDLKSSCAYIPHQNFKDWACSVNWFFLYIKQLTRDVYTNKDCKMSTTGRVEPLGNLKDSASILDTLTDQLQNHKMPVIICNKQVCRCGICAPKVKDTSTFTTLMKRYVTENVFL
jgi:pyruvate-formate lyase-activating enzyme